MIPRYLILLILLCWPYHTVFAAHETTCTPNPDTPVNVKAVYGDPTFDYSADLAKLQYLARDSAHIIPEGITLGLTFHTSVINVVPSSVAVEMPDGTTCVRVKEVNITYGFTNVVVYIAREIPQGTCGFDQVMTHEMRHVNVQKKIVEDYAPVLQKALKEYLAQNGTLHDRSYGEAVTWQRDNIQMLVQNILAGLINQDRYQQSQIDTVEEYTRVGNTCNGVFRDVVRAFMKAQHKS